MSGLPQAVSLPTGGVCLQVDGAAHPESTLPTASQTLTEFPTQRPKPALCTLGWGRPHP